MAVVFLEMDDGSADPWAVVDITGPYGSSREKLWARFKPPEWIEFGTDGRYHDEGSTRPPPSFPERRFTIRTLERVLRGEIPRTGGGEFIQKNRATTATYRTPCGEERTIDLNDLREIVEDAKGQMRDES